MGKISAKALINEGHIVYTVARNIDNMKDLSELGGHGIGMDVTIESDTEKVVKQIINEQGKIDILWNNAGYGLYGPVEEISIEKAKYQFEVNVFGVAKITQLVIPYMRSKKSGLIINTSSMGGKIYTPLGAWYHASKHAIEGWSDCLCLELKEFGINVVVLEPGIIETGFANGVKQHFSTESANGPYKKLATSYLNAMNNQNFKGSNPKIIADSVIKIINSKKPKTRYLVGQGAKLLVFMRNLLGDKVFDRLMLSQIK
jgi:short-subunit dehydrogenase